MITRCSHYAKALSWPTLVEMLRSVAEPTAGCGGLDKKDAYTVELRSSSFHSPLQLKCEWILGLERKRMSGPGIYTFVDARPSKMAVLLNTNIGPLSTNSWKIWRWHSACHRLAMNQKFRKRDPGFINSWITLYVYLPVFVHPSSILVDLARHWSVIQEYPESRSELAQLILLSYISEPYSTCPSSRSRHTLHLSSSWEIEAEQRG